MREGEREGEEICIGLQGSGWESSPYLCCILKEGEESNLEIKEKECRLS